MVHIQTKLSVSIDNPAISKELSRVTDLSSQAAARRLQGHARRIIKEEGRVDTGALLQSIRFRKARGGPEPYWIVYTESPYAMYQHEGVRPFGPKRAKALRWVDKRSGKVIFAQRSSGFEGIYFFRRAVERMTLRDFMP